MCTHTSFSSLLVQFHFRIVVQCKPGILQLEPGPHPSGYPVFAAYSWKVPGNGGVCFYFSSSCQCPFQAAVAKRVTFPSLPECSLEEKINSREHIPDTWTSRLLCETNGKMMIWVPGPALIKAPLVFPGKPSGLAFLLRSADVYCDVILTSLPRESGCLF